MPAAPTVRPRILTVGAYERDNFGDLLFLLVTEKYLPEADIVAAAPFAADMSELLDRKVGAYGQLLSEEQFDAVWTVGGQVGGTDLRSAFRMSSSADARAEYDAASPQRKADLLDVAVAGVPLVSPYIPAPALFPRNAGAVSVINSSGLAGIRGRQWHARMEMLEIFRTTDAISVRDAESSASLTEAGIAHTLAPDVVHALGVTDPFVRDPDADNVVVQVSNKILRELGARRLAHRLVANQDLADLKIRFLLAGAAAGHDSVEALEKVADEIRRIAPARELEIIEDRRPMDLVDHLRRARIVIGSSLHVRIVSAAYHVPRITFARRKPTAYAAHWDPHMPYGVDLAGFDQAIATALTVADRDDVLQASTRLTELAHENVRSLAELVMTTVKDRTADDVARRGAQRQASYAPLLESRRAADRDRIKFRTEIEGLRKNLAATRAELATLTAADQHREPVLTRARKKAGKVKRRLRR